MTQRARSTSKQPGNGRPQDRHLEYVVLDELVPAPRNPKQHDLASLRKAISRFGFTTPGLRDERTGRLVVGHGRAEALRLIRADAESPPAGIRINELGEWLVPVVCGWASRSDAEAEALLVADNRQNELGGWDTAGLAGLLEQLNDGDPSLLDAIGYTDGDLEDLLKLATPPDLDDLAAGVGDPDGSDSWPVIRLVVPKHVAAAWRTHLDEYEGEEVRAFAVLLDVDPAAPGPVAWSPEVTR